MCIYHITLTVILSLNYTACILILKHSLTMNKIHNETLLCIIYAYNILNKLNIWVKKNLPITKIWLVHVCIK